MIKNDFYLTLLSNLSIDYFPENTLAHFHTKLPQKIDLLGEWVVGVTEISFNISSSSQPKQRKIAAAKESVKYLIFEETGRKIEIKKKENVDYGTKIPILTNIISLNTALFLYLANTKLNLDQYYFESIMRKAVSRTLNTEDENHLLGSANQSIANPIVTIQIELDKDEIYNVPVYESKYPSMEDFLEKLILSIPKENRDIKKLLELARKSHIPPRVDIEYNDEIVSSVANHPALTFPTPVDFHKRELMFLYTDLIRPQFIGHSLSRCLRTILLINNSEVYKSFERIQYCKLERKNFDTVEILITTQDGLPYDFESSATPTMVVLHFKQL